MGTGAVPRGSGIRLVQRQLMREKEMFARHHRCAHVFAVCFIGLLASAATTARAVAPVVSVSDQAGDDDCWSAGGNICERCVYFSDDWEACNQWILSHMNMLTRIALYEKNSRGRHSVGTRFF